MFNPIRFIADVPFFSLSCDVWFKAHNFVTTTMWEFACRNLQKKVTWPVSVLALNDRKHNDKTYGQEMINTPQKRCYDIAR